ncbi:profilin-3-like [Amblyraja radiata]|uniref:profilin-3-like n=1 Tax=Amblyraja radiata TaxID=386614 RepID=UPI001401BBEF|nr:profilin-3-like [Amblyraja radiata]XP_055519213.1 profilin-3-like [Leucoraja erinacea]
MSDWKNYINSILKDKNVEDVAIVGHVNNKAVWASKPGGILAAISPQEVSTLMGQDRKTFLQTGITIGGKKCSVIRDNLLVNNDEVMDVRMKGGQCKSICIGKTIKTMVFVMGKRGVHGGVLNKKVHEMASYLKQKGF